MTESTSGRADGRAPVRLVGRDFVGFRNAVDRQARAWGAGVLEPEWLELDDLERQLLVEGRARSGSADLVLVVSDWIPHLVQNGDLRPLDDLLAARPPDQWPQGWSASMRDLLRGTDGATYGLAYHDGPMMTLYRGDLYEDPAEQDGFAARYRYPLGPPLTWDQYLDQATWFNRPDQGLWGTVLAGKPDGHNTVYDFLLQLWSRGGALSRGGQVVLAEEPGRSALAFLDRMWNEHGVIDPAARGYDSVASGQAFADGHAAMTVNWCGFAALSALPGSPTRGDVRCAQIPAGAADGSPAVSMNVFWAFGIASGSADPAAAYDFLRHVCSPEMDRITSQEGATGTRLSTWRDPEVQALAPYYVVIEQVHESVASPPSVTTWPMVAATLNTMVDDVVNRRTSVEDGLSRAAEEIERAGWLRPGSA